MIIFVAINAGGFGYRSQDTKALPDCSGAYKEEDFWLLELNKQDSK